MRRRRKREAILTDDLFAESVLHGLPKIGDCGAPTEDSADVWLARMGEALLRRRAPATGAI
jgi:hypothetical protein